MPGHASGGHVHTECPFCTIARDRLPEHGLLEERGCFVILDREPLAFGHCMVISRHHARTVYELDAASYHAVFDLARRLAPALQSATSARGIGFVAFGVGLPHAHLHLVPMDSDEVLLRPAPSRVPDEVLAEHARRLRPLLQLSQRDDHG